MRRRLAQLHMWTGAIAGLPLILIAASGVGLSFLGALIQLETGALTPGADERGVPVSASVLVDNAVASQPAGFRPLGIFAPGSRLEVDAAMVFGLPANAASSAEAVIVGLDPATGEVLGSFVLHKTWSHTLLRFHHHMLMGATGSLVFAITALCLIVFSVSGFMLWGARAGGAVKKLQMAGALSKRGSPFGLHSLFGVAMGAFVFVWALSGVLWLKPAWFAPLVPSAAAGLSADQAERFQQSCSSEVLLDDAVTKARALRPGAAISQISFPNPGQPYFTISLKAPGDLDRYYGDARVYVHAACKGVAALSTINPPGAGEVVRSLTASLHSGRIFGAGGVVLTTLIGLTLLLMVATGVIAFFRRVGIKGV